MNKPLTIISAVLLSMSLVACGNNSKKAASSSSKSESTKVVKHHKRSHKSKKNKQQTQKQSQSNSNNQQAANKGQNEAQSQNNNSNGNGSSSNGLPPADSLSDFVNRYGVSPALWKEQHGMSAQDALMSTPESMRTSGENQDVTGIQQGYIDPNSLQSNGQ